LADIAVVWQILIAINQGPLIDADIEMISKPGGFKSLSAQNHIVTDLI
jgi:hypothetical protein